MTIYAAKLERSMEERVTRLESHFEHIQNDVAEMKADIRRLDQKIDRKFDSLKDSVSEFRSSMERSVHRLTLWGLALYLALASSLLGVMAKGFGWI